MTDVSESDKVCQASAISATEPETTPAQNLIANKAALTIMETRPWVMPFFEDSWDNMLQRYENFSYLCSLKTTLNMRNIVLLGPPGSGKGTQAARLVKEFGLTHISTGDCLRREIAAGTPIGKEVEAIIAGGNYVSDDIVNEIIERFERMFPDTNGYLFDGYPRTSSQAEFLDKSLASQGYTITAAIDLDVEDEVLVKRITLRGQLSGRSDDNEETARTRIQVYHEKTRILEEFYRKQGKLHEVRGDFPIDETWDKVKAIVESL
jgi:adenylate kinase